ncbi:MULTISPECIES: hypothetical protein [Gammaproteobacteria]|uniref:hypothetical protein n=1 Tax=Gammaproteobacteria TaxID=1236 RepID=UPI000DD00BF8|nr:MULTISPECIES: hypothetical protein [Gammaproteobacteria]RTE86088.1 hypothetical protein DQX04_05820 [Aliidiomarina sp. B3213]TCZ91442.1 hypothetical protein EYQ95_05830 [Lysobacter sp. N42]
MQETINLHQIYGLAANSPIAIPSLRLSSNVKPELDIKIEPAKDPVTQERIVCARESGIHIKIPDLGEVSATAHTLTVRPYHSGLEYCENLILGSGVSSVLHLHNEIPMHGMAVVPPNSNEAWVIFGRSGSGKSTLTLALLLQGFTILSDDSIRLKKTSEGVFAYPTSTRLKCEPHYLEYIKNHYAKARSSLIAPHKCIVDLKENCVSHQPVKVSFMAQLLPHKKAQLSLHKVTRTKQMKWLSINVLRPRVIRVLEQQELMFEHFTHLTKVPFYVIEAPNLNTHRSLIDYGQTMSKQLENINATSTL